MKPPEKEAPRSRRLKSLPYPPLEVESALPLPAQTEVEVRRFGGRSAQLAALSTQLRLSESPRDKAIAAGRLARQLMRRNIELRDALALGEKSLTIVADSELARDVGYWWSAVGDLARSSTVLSAIADELPLEQRKEALLSMSWAEIRRGADDAAARALRRLMELSPDDPRPLELFGALGFWSTLPRAECAQAYLQAAQLRQRMQDEANAFECEMRAFEVDGRCLGAALGLANKLRARGRAGAADEILRELLRSESSAQRAAYHQRAFSAALDKNALEVCFESALEAELDIDLDVARVHELLSQLSEQGALGDKRDFESLLVHLLVDGSWGQENTLASWLLALCEVSRGTQEEHVIKQIAAQLVARFAAEDLPLLDLADNEGKIATMKARLVTEAHANRDLRFELSRRLCAQKAWSDAALVLEPLLEGGDVSVALATFGAALGGRTSNALLRVRSLVALAPAFPPPAGAVTYAVAAERLLNLGLTQEARQAADAAVEASPNNERALATQALVALRAPDGASATLLEHALSVLVARSDTCALLAESAAQRGSARLAISWAGRAFNLRPGDVHAARRYLQQSCAQRDATTIMEALSEVLEQPLPLVNLESDICDCLTLLRQTERKDIEELGRKLLGRCSITQTILFDKLADLALASDAHELLSTLIELRLIASPPEERSDLYLELTSARFASSNFVAAARALRRSNPTPDLRLKLWVEKFPDSDDGDVLLPLLELRAELTDGVSTQEQQQNLLVAGSARWDLAQDLEAAVQYWLRAAELDPESGLDLFASCLRQVAGPVVAVEQLTALAQQTADPLRSGRLLGLAAHDLLRLGNREEAFRVGTTALERAPSLSGVLTIVEAAAGESSLHELDRLYQLLADRAAGRFGERAAHYRAARQLEKRGALDAALRHACAAFEAEPAEGVAYVMMARLADATLGHAQLLSALGRAADQASTDAERGRWIGLAAALSDTESIGRKERLEILFRAAQMMPQSDSLEHLFDGLAHCLADDPKARDELWERFVKLARDTSTSCTGADGAALCLAFAVTALSHFEQPDFALQCLNRAIECDTTSEDYERLLPYVTQLAGLVGEASNMVETVRATEQQKGALLGRGLARIAGRVAAILGETEVQAELLVRAAADFPDDARLLGEARKAAQQSARADLVARVEALLPARERAQVVLDKLTALTNEQGLDALMDIDLTALPDADKARILTERAQRQAVIGRLDDAIATYRQLLDVDPNSDVALRGLERHAESQGDNETLLQILGRRIELSQDPGDVRRLTLRRAAVLEMKLGRAQEARKLLSEFLRRGEDRAALRLLADSWERTGDHTEAAELWLRVHAVALDSIEADDAAYRAATCFFQAGNPRRAQVSISQIAKPGLAHLQLALDVARAIDERAMIFEAIVQLCDVIVGDTVRLEKLLIEAAELALLDKRMDDARRVADRALSLNPDSKAAKLLVGRLRAQSGALSTSIQAQEMASLLRGTETLDNADDRELACFLKAKSQMLSGDQDGARSFLESAMQEQGQRPLLSALLADILDDQQAERALELIDVALRGPRHGFYSDGELAVRAANFAHKLGDVARAKDYLLAVTTDDPFWTQAADGLKALEEPPPSVQAVAADGSDLEAIRNAAREEHRRATRAVLDQAELAGRTDRRSSRPSLRAIIALQDGAEDGPQLSSTGASDDPLSIYYPAQALVGIVNQWKEPEFPSSPPVAAFATSAKETDEALLVRLEAGEVDAGMQLLDRFGADKSRSRDAVLVAQHLVLLDPSDAQLLGRLVTAAYRDGNTALATAVRHVLGAYGAGTYVAPPALDEVTGQNGEGLSLLRQVNGAANEALAIVWEHAAGFFKKDLSEYDVSGLERVSFNAPHVLGALCMGVSKVTGLVKTPVFVASGAEEISIQVALLQPPAVMISGQIEELSPELVFHFGAMMAACAPEHALLFGAPRELVDNVLSALAMSFGAGRPDNRARPPAEVTRVAAYLWEAVPARAQRRLTQLCAEPEELTYEALSGHSRLAVRRAGLMACGDLPTAIDDACLDFGLPVPRSLSELAQAVQASPAVLDLLQLALSSEYAQIRFMNSK